MTVELKSNARGALTTIEREASRLVRKTALEIEAAIKADMTSAKHGREVKRGKKTHRASAPGEAPAVDSGALVNSVQAEMVSPLAAEIGTPQEYAPPLEQGTEEISPRPAWKRAGEKAGKTFLRNAQRLR